MRKKRNWNETKDFIVKWMNERLEESGCIGWVIGVSGGVDSALVSTLAAETGRPVRAVSMPINQEVGQHDRSLDHIKWLRENYANISGSTVDLTPAFNTLTLSIPAYHRSTLADVNTASRLRMVTLYSFANTHNSLVVGTGNKVEDHGVGFFTKYGDGGVDISPIADLTKSEVRRFAKFLGISEEIVKATPTDGLWEDNRSDEDQIGATYSELEWAMREHDLQGEDESCLEWDLMTGREKEVMKIYLERHNGSRHKLKMPPVCILN